MSAHPSSLVTSALLPVPHGFATRAGGVSEGPHASLNLGFAVGDLRERVEENHRRLAGMAGAALESLHTVKQVHGDRVVEAGAGEGTGALRPPEGEADALWTERPEHWVAVGTADCVPVLLVDPEGRRVAAVHSGWRGTDARIVARAVESLVARGSRPERLLAAVGPPSSAAATSSPRTSASASPRASARRWCSASEETCAWISHGPCVTRCWERG